MNFKDITNKRFNKLVAVSFAKRKNNATYWIFRCDCGKSKTIISSNVINNSTKSCGCAKVWNKGKINIYTNATLKKMSDARVGASWGRHTQKSRDEISKKQIGIGNSFYGKHHSIQTKERIGKMKRGVKIPDAVRKKMGDARRGVRRPDLVGKNNHFWNGGRTTLYNKIIHLIEYRQWRSSVFKRDNFICQLCQYSRGKILNAHHIITRCQIIKKHNIKNVEEAILCTQLWDINNGITLCKRCHETTYGKENKFEEKFYAIIKKN